MYCGVRALAACRLDTGACSSLQPHGETTIHQTGRAEADAEPAAHGGEHSARGALLQPQGECPLPNKNTFITIEDFILTNLGLDKPNFDPKSKRRRMFPGLTRAKGPPQLRNPTMPTVLVPLLPAAPI